MCDNLFNGTFPEEQEYVQTVVANVEMVSNLIKQVILSSKSQSSQLSSRFPASYLLSSLDPGVTEREGSHSFLSPTLATFSSAWQWLSTLTSLMNSMWSFSGLKTSRPCAALTSSSSLAAMDSWLTQPQLKQGKDYKARHMIAFFQIVGLSVWPSWMVASSAWRSSAITSMGLFSSG